MSPWLFLVVTTLASARIARLIFKDTLFDDLRERIVNALEDEYVVGAYDPDGVPVPGTISRRRFAAIRVKIAYLITCPYCVTFYTTIGVLGGYRIWVASFEAPALYFFAVWMLSIVVLEYTDGDED